MLCCDDNLYIVFESKYRPISNSVGIYTPQFGEDKFYILTSNDRVHRKLSKLDYDLLRLHYGLKMPIKFIARQRNVSYNNVYQKIYRMRKIAYIYKFAEMTPDEIELLIEKIKSWENV